MILLLSLAWVLIVAGLLTRAISQYNKYEVIRPAAGGARADGPTVSIIVPARNEEGNIGRCISALLEQDYPADKIRVIVIDDNSEDATGAIVQEIARREPRIRLIHNDSLPPGWTGKPYACWRGVSEASGEWLCFIDADTIARPPLIRTALSAVTERRLDVLSLQPFQELGGFWERLLLPAGFFLIAFTQDLGATNDPTTDEAAVNGQFLFIRQTAYAAVGGHAAVRDAVAEDSALARLLKRGGWRLGVLGTEGLLQTRMYTTPRSLFEGTARQAASLLGGIGLPIAAAGALLLALAPLIVPIWAIMDVVAFGGIKGDLALGFALAGSLALLGTHIGAAHYFRIPFWYGLLFPVSYLLGAGVLVFASWQRLGGRTRWKGRVYGNSSGAADAAAHSAAGDLPHHV